MKPDTIPVIMPQLGVNDREILILEWLMPAGAEVRAGQAIAQVETSKATLDLECEAAGFLYPLVEAGTQVPIGAPVAIISREQDANVVAQYRMRQATSAAAPAQSRGAFEATDKARALIERHGIDITRLPQGRIVRERDVRALLAGDAAPPLEVPEELRRRVAIFGASQGGLAVLDCLRSMEGYEAVAFLDDASHLHGTVCGGLPVWPGTVLAELRTRGVGAIATHLAQGRARLEVLRRAYQAGLEPLNTVHARATVAPTVQMGWGNLVKAGAVLDTAVELGNGCIIDNGAIVPHHNRIGDGCHLAPGATLGGDCSIGEFTVVGIGAVVSARLRIGSNVIVGAGAVVLRDLPAGVVVEGNPARIVGERKPLP